MASLNNTLRTNMMSQIATSLGATGHLLIYSGTAPAKTAAPTGTLLANFTLANPAGTSAGGVFTLTVPSNVTGAANGTPGYGRFIDGATDDGTHTQIQTTAGVASGELNFVTGISAGGTVSLTGFTVTENDS